MLLTNETTISDKRQLISYMEQSCKPKSHWRVGVEYEQFISDLATNKPLSYVGSPGISHIFHSLAQCGWLPQIEQGIVIKLQKSLSAISLEPGGQLEFATTPHANIHNLNDEIQSYIAMLDIICKKHDVLFTPVGAHPDWLLEDISQIPNPNGRYEILQKYMKQTGTHGLDMMLRTCSLQVSLDYGSESDMIKKYKVALLLQPIVSALFANSSRVNGSQCKYLSYRTHAWMNTNAERCGILPIIYSDKFSFESYVDYMLQMPLYFVCRNGVYIDALGQPFKDFIKGQLSILPNELPSLADWIVHLKSIWPEARLTNVIEMRGTDSGAPAAASALSALWVGLLYDESGLDSAWDLVKSWSSDFVEQLRISINCEGLNAKVGRHSMFDIASQLILLAKHGLEKRAQYNDLCESEDLFLSYLKNNG